jgi:transposase
MDTAGSRGIGRRDRPWQPAAPHRGNEGLHEEQKLSEERTWNATQLAEALEEEFGLAVSPEAARQHLHAMGYSWKRTR